MNNMNNNMGNNMRNNTRNNMNSPENLQRLQDDGTYSNISEDRTFNTPPQQNFNTPEMQGSMQKILSDNIGEYVVAEFLIGTDRMTRKQGILYFVGTSFVTLYDDVHNNYIVCDIFSIKFVYFYYPGQRPSRNFNVLPNSNGNS
ncbi:MAG: hypothetical protein UE295_04930 [Acutalibacteraceae bacterium]|nr:hypothetical protein [Acutalibacteraceae bacterium]MEE0265726.1 hypothetical protein [Acutalibacteraceae bacterium]